MAHAPFAPAFSENYPDYQEHVIWKVKSSQFINLKFFILMSFGFFVFLFLGFHATPWLLFLSLVFALMAGYRYMYTNSILYTLTDQRLIQESGVFTKVTFEIELYRIKDIHLIEPFIYRLDKIGNIRIISSQKSVHFDILPGLKEPKQRWNELRNFVEKRRTEKGVRESDVSY